MLTRLLPAAASFAIVAAIYGAYALVAVPMIEPEAERTFAGGFSGDETGGGNLADKRMRRFHGLFPADSWIHESPKVLESDRVLLITRDYRNLGDGRIDISPCTMIFTSGGADADAEELRKSVILEAPEGAILEFDSPLELSQAKIGRLVGGKLNGRVTIRGQGEDPGPNDDLMIVTRNVQLSERHVWTPHQVDFRLGPNYGRGEQMNIKLLAEKNDDNESGPNISGVESFTLKRVHRLHVELAEKEIPDGAGTAPKKAAGDEEQLPVEVTCRGPFHFDVLKKVATFSDQVNVIRINPTGPGDQLKCELLSIFFEDRDEVSGKNKPPKQQSLNLKPVRIEARGGPVIVSAPSQKAHARGEVLTYELETKKIVLDGHDEVLLRQDKSEIHAKKLEYQTAEDGRLGMVSAKGPGWIRAEMGDKAGDGAGERLEANWKDNLLVRPHEQNQVISLTGGTTLLFRGLGRLDATEIHFWLNETPIVDPKNPTKKKYRLTPDRMLAKTNVLMNSEELSGRVDQLEVWFETRPGVTVAGATPVRPAAGRTVADATSPAGQPAEQPPAEPPKPKSHFEITGRLLQARVVLNEGADTQLSEIIVEDGMRFVETKTAKPDERPMLIAGDRLHVVDATEPHAAITVTAPAHFEGRGLGLTGANINLNRGTNRLTIDGPGRMDLPMDRDFQGNPLATPGTMQVQWQHHMIFDGRTAQFDESVNAFGPQQRLQTERLEVVFDKPIDFAEEKMETEPQVEQISCTGGVFMENRTIEKQRQTSLDRMQVGDMRINLISGAMTAGGPGWLHSIRFRTDDMPGAGGLAGAAPIAATSEKKDEKKDQLIGLHVKFQGSISGNVNNRTMTFNERVRTAYAPVEDWQTILETDDPDALGEDGVLLTCDKLSVAQMTAPLTGQTSVELEAEGNTVVENSTFTARSKRMKYADGKGLLVLEGDGRNDARLFRQLRVGAPASEMAARRIFYWPRTGVVRIDGLRNITGVESVSRKP